MARRPPLNDDTFLSALFRPSKNPLPVGLRKTKLKGGRGTVRARVNAYNRMPAKNQYILSLTGKREAYLKGEVTLADAKKELRGRAESKGIVKPLKPRRPTAVVTGETKLKSGLTVDDAITARIVERLQGRTVGRLDASNIHRRVQKSPNAIKRLLATASPDEHLRHAKDGDILVELDDDQPFNPFHYK